MQVEGDNDLSPQRDASFALGVGLLPGLIALVGFIVGWRRRREPPLRRVERS